MNNLMMTKYMRNMIQDFQKPKEAIQKEKEIEREEKIKEIRN
jgi:hypothetical protein